MILKLKYNSITFETDFFTEDFDRKEIYYNNLNQADNSVSLTIPFNVEIQNFINLYADNNIMGQIIDGTNVIWTGYVRKNFNFGKKQRNQPIKIELVSPSYLLDQETNDYFVLSNTNLGIAVQSLLTKAGFSSSVELTENIGLFQIQPNTNIKSTLTELLFNYGYCYDFDNEGRFIIYPLFNTPETKTITQVFDGSNCRDEIKIEKKEQDYDGTSVQWSQVELVKNKLIFADTTDGNNDSYSCSITLQPKQYLGEVSDATSYYIEYDCAEGKVLNATSGNLTLESSNNSGLTYTFENLGNQGKLSVYNKSSSPIVITKIVVYGDAYVEKSQNLSKSAKGTKFKEIKTTFIHNSQYADKLAKNYTEWLIYSDYTVKLKSYTDYSLGSFVKITETGLGTIYGRIVEKDYNIRKEPIQYKIEAVSDYEPAEINSYTKKKSTYLINGIIGKDGEAGPQGESGAKGDAGISMRNKGTWESGTAYVNNSSYIDVVYYATNGCSYSCIKSHTASSSILPTNTTYWSLVASKGDKGDPGQSITGPQGNRGPMYLGYYTSDANCINTIGASNIVVGDYYLYSDGYLWTTSNKTSFSNKITSYSDYRYFEAMNDIINLSATLTSNANLKTAVNSWVQNLVAGTALIEKLFAKSITVQSGGSIQSSNFSSGSSGFKISSNGTIEACSGRFSGGLGKNVSICSISYFTSTGAVNTAKSMSGTFTTSGHQKIVVSLTNTLNYTSRPIAELENFLVVGKGVSSNCFNGEIFDSKLSISSSGPNLVFTYSNISMSLTTSGPEGYSLSLNVMQL